MLERLISLMMLIIAVIHIAPLVGVLSATKLHTLYQITIDDPNLEILLRHRAILFGVLGGYFAYAAFQPSLQPAAMIIAAVSIVSFLLLAYSVGDYNTGIRKVVIADLVALACLLLAIIGYWLKTR